MIQTLLKIDWLKVILNLRAQKLTNKAIAHKIGVHYKTIDKITGRRTVTPSLPVMDALLDLHYDKVPHLHKISVIGKP